MSSPADSFIYGGFALVEVTRGSAWVPPQACCHKFWFRLKTRMPTQETLYKNFSTLKIKPLVTHNCQGFRKKYFIFIFFDIIQNERHLI